MTSTVGVTFMSRGGGMLSSLIRGAVVVTLVTGDTVTCALAAAGRQFLSPGTRWRRGWDVGLELATLAAALDSCEADAAEFW